MTIASAAASLLLAQTPDESAALAIKAVRSVTSAGVTYKAYSDRVLEARVKADQAQLDPKLKLALEYYETAMQAWSLKFGHDAQSFARSIAVGRKVEGFGDCKQAAELTGSIDKSFKKPPEANLRYSMIGNALAQRPNLLWACAGDLIDGK